MLPTTLCIAGIGLVLGLVLLHWMTLAFVSVAGTIAYVLVSPWNWLLLPTWFGLLTAFQLSYLAGAGIRLWLAAPESVESSAVDHSQDLLGERVLIVEDEPLIAAHLAQEIEAVSGQPLGPAGSVAEALAIIGQGGVDAAVLDVKLADGEVTPVAFELMDRDVPFVILTSLGTPPGITARRPGVPVFRKPVPLESPIRSLTEQIRRTGRPRKPGKPTLRAS